MRKGYRSMVFVGVGLLAAATVFAGDLHRHGTVTPSSQTIWSLNTPAAGATVFGIVEVRGFVLNPQRGISKITLLVDGAAVHDADLNKPRVDVRRRYPGFEGEPFPEEPGFATSFLASNYEDGEHTIAVQVTYAGATLGSGETQTEVIGERTVMIDNSLNQPPLGALDSPRDPDQVGMYDYVSGAYPITGWAIDDQGVRMTTAPDGSPRADIEVMVDGQVMGQALYKLPRPDVANDHPDVAAAFLSGFQMNLDTTRVTNGMHTISVRAWDVMGASRILGRRTVSIDNSYATLKPIGHIDFPMPNAHFYSTSCYTHEPPSGVEYEIGHHVDWVSGWVVDQNDQYRFEGVKYVELLLDGSLLKRTSTDCVYLQDFDMQVNCYGLYQRPDILLQYPQFASDAKYSGFFFAVDTDYLLSLGYHEGLHYLAIRVGTQDPNRPAVVIDQIPVILECNYTGKIPIFGELEQPVTMQLMKGSELVKGWALQSPGQLWRLNFYVDGILDGTLVEPSNSINMTRTDLEDKYPWLPYPQVRHTGFEYTLDTTKYVDGMHQLVIEGVDFAGNSYYWVQRPVVFDNAN